MSKSVTKLDAEELEQAEKEYIKYLKKEQEKNQEDKNNADLENKRLKSFEKKKSKKKNDDNVVFAEKTDEMLKIERMKYFELLEAHLRYKPTFDKSSLLSNSMKSL